MADKIININKIVKDNKKKQEQVVCTSDLKSGGKAEFTLLCFCRRKPELFRAVENDISEHC